MAKQYYKFIVIGVLLLISSMSWAMNDTELGLLFSQKNQKCTINIFRELSDKNELKSSAAHFSRAMEIGLIDDVQVDILNSYSKLLSKIRINRNSNVSLKFNKGNNLFKRFYQQDIKDRSKCLSTQVKDFNDITVNNSLDSKIEIDKEFNLLALKKRYINKKEFKLIELARLINTSSLLSFDEYKKKKKRLMRFGYTINSQYTEFHKNTKVNDKGIRYRLYDSFNLEQQDQMLQLVMELKRRIENHKSLILFLKEDNSVAEKIDLTPQEQLHLSLKLYNVEKINLLNTEAFKGKGFQYNDLIAIAYETSHIDDFDIEALEMLKRKIEKESFAQKAVKYAEKADFIVTALTGPLGGFVYVLSLGVLNNFVNKDKKKADFKHDLFYGNCEMKL